MLRPFGKPPDSASASDQLTRGSGQAGDCGRPRTPGRDSSGKLPPTAITITRSLNGVKTLSEVARVATQQAERNLIIPHASPRALEPAKAATMLGISYKTLLNKIKEHGIVQSGRRAQNAWPMLICILQRRL